MNPESYPNPPTQTGISPQATSLPGGMPFPPAAAPAASTLAALPLAPASSPATLQPAAPAEAMPPGQADASDVAQAVAAAKAAILRTDHDPFAQSQALQQVKAAYIRARYHIDLKIVGQ